VKIPNKGICTKKCWDRVDMDRDKKKKHLWEDREKWRRLYNKITHEGVNVNK
jgi:hypothetical protein